jgi:hypothetical protein
MEIVMSLIQQVPNKIVLDPRFYMTLIYGEAGVGKTSWAAEVPGAYFLKCEDGTQGVSVYGHNITSWEKFIESCEELVEQKRNNFKDVRPITTIIVDVYELLWRLAGQWICDNEKFLENGKLVKYNRIEDISWGKGYNRTNLLVLEKLNKLMLEGFGVILLSHIKQSVITWAGKDYQSVGPNLSGSAQDAIIDACGAVGYCCIEEKIERVENEIKNIEQGRYIYWQPTFLRRAKHRLKGFPEKIQYKYGCGWFDYVKEFEKVAQQTVERIGVN